MKFIKVHPIYWSKDENEKEFPKVSNVKILNVNSIKICEKSEIRLIGDKGLELSQLHNLRADLGDEAISKYATEIIFKSFFTKRIVVAESLDYLYEQLNE